MASPTPTITRRVLSDLNINAAVASQQKSSKGSAPNQTGSPRKPTKVVDTASSEVYFTVPLPSSEPSFPDPGQSSQMGNTILKEVGMGGTKRPSSAMCCSTLPKGAKEGEAWTEAAVHNQRRRWGRYRRGEVSEEVHNETSGDERQERRRHIQTGILSPNGETCDEDEGIFSGSDQDDQIGTGRDAGELEDIHRSYIANGDICQAATPSPYLDEDMGKSYSTSPMASYTRGYQSSPEDTKPGICLAGGLEHDSRDQTHGDKAPTNSKQRINDSLRTPEQIRQNARAMRLRLSLASYKLRTNQLDVPLGRLQVKTMSSNLPPLPRLSHHDRATRQRKALPSGPVAHIPHEPPSKKAKIGFYRSVSSSPDRFLQSSQESVTTPILPEQRRSLFNPPNLNSPLWAQTPEHGSPCADLTSSVVKDRAADGLLSLMGAHK